MKKIVFPIVSSLLLAAHFSRAQNDWLAFFSLLFPLILLIKKRWILRIFQTYLIMSGLLWIESIVRYANIREAQGRPWLRLAIILSAVALFTFISALILENRGIRKRYTEKSPDGELPYLPSFISFLLTGTLLAIIHFKVTLPILLLERFLPGIGLIEIACLAIYAAWITEKMLDAKISSKIRVRIWILFSIVFFSQFILGLAGLEKCLMTGKLHLPIPALIIGGPIFRGSGFFMPILFVSTVLLAGAAWCSHLCYVGAWDNLSSRNTHLPKPLPHWGRPARIVIFFLVILSAFLFRMTGLSTAVAAGIAILYGIAGVGIMVFISRKNGAMTHCVIYCPIGLAANLIGRISPFRIRFTEACDDCGACQSSCRYDALNEGNIQKRKPAISCTLCGDCISKCSKDALAYGFLGLSSKIARTIFIVVIVSLHAVFLGVARI